MIGKTLSHYKIVEKIGAGGMGEVYRAVDTRLDRPVAIKILPERFSSDPELRQRFEREARVISALAHPHICTLHDIGHEDGTDFLVMEFLEGETLASRLARGRLPPSEVLRFGAQIGEGLHAAHRAGIVHRDLKPGNIMLTGSGVKLLDFGLAKIRDAETPGEEAAATRAMTPEPLTERGTILGTFQYMAPEQLEGREADERTDIFSLGAVLYEMATGQRAFEGESRASLIAAILERDPPPLSDLQPMMPLSLDRAVRKCLAKSPDERWQSAGDVASELKWIAEDSSRSGVPAPLGVRRQLHERIVWGLAGACVGAGLAALVMVFAPSGKTPPTAGAIRFEIAPPEGVVSVGCPRLSPDGRYLAFNATDDEGFTRIWLRAFDGTAARPLPGTDGAWRPFWSPDSRFLGYFCEGKLKRVEIPHGSAVTICDAPGAADGAWGTAGNVLFDGGPGDSIRCLPASREAPRAATRIDRSRGEVSHMWPHFLPDGRHFLYLASGRSRTGADRWLKIGVLDSDLAKVLAPGESRPEYAPPGYVLFVRGGDLVAQRFSPGSLELSGEPRVVAAEVGCGGSGLANFSVSENGLLAYSRSSRVVSRLVWTDRAGREIGTVGEHAAYANPCISPDGKRIAVEVVDPATRTEDIWILYPARGTATRFTFDPSEDMNPVWSPDGSEIVFSSGGSGTIGFALHAKSADGAGEEHPFLAPEEDLFPTDWSADGRFIAGETWVSNTLVDILIVPTLEDREPFAFLQTPFNEFAARFSPDGRFVAYSSDESGRWEVYVRSFPGSEGKWHISNGGGTEPQWRGDGKELFYVGPDRTLMSVEVSADPTFSAGAPTPLFAAPVAPDVTSRNRYVASADGQRFLFVSPLASGSLSAISVVINWTELLPDD